MNGEDPAVVAMYLAALGWVLVTALRALWHWGRSDTVHRPEGPRE